VTPQNFKDPVRGDVFTSVAGPASNFLLVVLSMLGLIVAGSLSPAGRELITGSGPEVELSSPWIPVVVLLYTAVKLNVLLGVFNLIPVPPLDGSHVLRHLLPDSLRRIYDQAGMVGLVLLFLFGGKYVWFLMRPILNFVDSIIIRAVH
jgi:Zn-dependent protease